jgi:hypothetical protein
MEPQTAEDLTTSAPTIPFRTRDEDESSPVRAESVRSSSDLFTTSAQHNTHNLAASEPALRFPRPQGNLYLANWVSTSNIKTMTQIPAYEDDRSLSDSFEFVSAEPYYPDLDTDIASGSELSQLDSPSNESECDQACGPSDEAEAEEDEGHHVVTESDVEGDLDEDETEINEPEEAEEAEDAHEADNTVDAEGSSTHSLATAVDLGGYFSDQANEFRARAPSIDSIEYTERSLQLPSKASDDDKTDEAEEQPRRFTSRVRHVFESRGILRPGDPAILDVVRLLLVFLAGFAVTLVATYCESQCLKAFNSAMSLYADANMPTSVTIMNYTITRTVTVTRAPPEATIATTCPFGFLSDAQNSSLRGSPNFAEVTPQREVLITMKTAPAVGSTILKVSRGNETLRSKFSHTKQGILVQLEPMDAYGLVSVNVASSRRSRVNQTFEVDLGCGSIAQMLDTGLLLVHDIADRAVTGARTMVASAESKALSASAALSSNLRNVNVAGVVDAAKDVASSINSGISAATTTLKKSQDLAQSRIKELVAAREDYVEEVELGVLKAQITSRLLYYKAMNMQDKYDEYSRKARLHMEQQRKTVAMQREKRARQAQRVPESSSEPAYWKLWRKGL